MPQIRPTTDALLLRMAGIPSRVSGSPYYDVENTQYAVDREPFYYAELAVQQMCTARNRPQPDYLLVRNNEHFSVLEAAIYRSREDRFA